MTSLIAPLSYCARRERKASEPITVDIRHIEDEKKGDLCSLDWRENKNKLNVKAIEYGRGHSGWVSPKIEAGAVGTKARGRAEKLLSEGGRAPFSPFAHLKGAALDRLIKDIDWKKDGGEDLIKDIDWKKDGGEDTCERIYFFLAFNAPDGYVNGNLAWLFDFVNKNAPRIEKQVRELQKNK
ncbi:hypothetical protein FOZ62_013115 [Perkinsus olseni]|uniref:Uncharacterized protein n=1 Tax=Perkinsus olseni TaxID=32597 RepID=A0A7J6RKJ1_PEROL|nr:hypothetical protein FOZ62_013115 [Perkinsus olseni]